MAAVPSWAVLAELARKTAAAVGSETMSQAGRRGATATAAEAAPSAQALLRTFGGGKSALGSAANLPTLSAVRSKHLSE